MPATRVSDRRLPWPNHVMTYLSRQLAFRCSGIGLADFAVAFARGERHHFRGVRPPCPRLAHLLADDRGHLDDRRMRSANNLSRMLGSSLSLGEEPTAATSSFVGHVLRNVDAFPPVGGPVGFCGHECRWRLRHVEAGRLGSAACVLTAHSRWLILLSMSMGRTALSRLT